MPVGRWSGPFVALLALAQAGCNGAVSPSLAGPPPASAATEVEVVSPKRQVLRWSVEQPGTLAAFETTPVVAKLAGYVREIAPDPTAREDPGTPDAVIDIGSPVTRGQLLATLDIPELAAEAAQKRAVVDQSKTELEQVRKDLAVADAQVTAARAVVKEAEAGVTRAAAEVDRWRTELAQADDLVGKKVIDAQSRAVIFKQAQAADAARAEAEARVATAAAALGERQARRAKADADLAAAASRVAVAEAAGREVEARLGYTRITAPFDGLVTARHVHTRHFVQPPPGAGGHVLFVVARLDVVRVFVDVPEADAAKAVRGAKAVVRVPALGNREFPGTVTRTAGVVQPETRTLRAEIDLPNPGRVLRPGVYALARIEAETTDAIVLPTACLLAADEARAVFVVEGDRAVKYRVQLGRVEGGTAQVLGRRRATAAVGPAEPFTGSERVVRGNLGALADGAAVVVKE